MGSSALPLSVLFRRCMQLQLTVVGLFACSLPVLAAELEPIMDLLVFDAVPLRIDSQKSASSNDTSPYQATELQPLPRENPKKIIDLLQRSAAAQTGDDNSPPDVALIEGKLKQQEAKGNSFDKGQAEALMELANAYEKSGNYTKALSLYERVNHIIRIDEGLYSLGQEPVLQRMIGNHIARGDLAAADQTQQYLFYLRSKTYGRNSLSLVPALQDLAMWNVAAYRMASMISPPAVSANSAEKSKPSAPAKNSYYDQLISRLDHLRAAHEINNALVQMLQKQGDQRLPQAEYQFASTNFLYTRMLTTVNPMMGDSFGEASFYWGTQEYRSNFSDGRKALEQRLKLLTSTPGVSVEEQTHARLDLIDWMIATNNRSDLRELAENTYQQYIAATGDTPEAKQVFDPLLPVAVPTFVVQANTRSSLGIPETAALEYRGHIDVEFDLSPLGDTTNITVLNKTNDTPTKVTETLLRSIRRGQFRPHLHDGKIAAHKDIRVRYYYTW